jgi:hypothetical protein
MRNGNFYSSSGVSLDDLESSDRHIEFSISQIGASLYSTKLIGENGRVLKEISGNKIKYEFEGNEGYVRAEVMDSDGAFAWTQPVFLS